MSTLFSGNSLRLVSTYAVRCCKEVGWTREWEEEREGGRGIRGWEGGEEYGWVGEWMGGRVMGGWWGERGRESDEKERKGRESIGRVYELLGRGNDVWYRERKEERERGMRWQRVDGSTKSHSHNYLTYTAFHTFDFYLLNSTSIVAIYVTYSSLCFSVLSLYVHSWHRLLPDRFLSKGPTLAAATALLHRNQ